jgi:hypothetical protein
MSEPHDPSNAPGNPHPPGRPISQDVQHSPVAARIPDQVRRGVFSSAVMVLQCNDDFVIDFLSMIVPPQQVVSRVVLSASTFTKLVGALQINVAEYQKTFGPLAAQEPVPAKPAVPPEQAVPQVPIERMPGEPAAPHGGIPGSAPGSVPGGTPHMGSPGIPSPAAGPAVPPPAQAPQPPAPPQPVPQPHQSSDVTDIAEVYGQLKLPDEMLGGAYATGAMIRHTPTEFAIDFITNFYPRAVVTARVFLAAGRIRSFLDTFQNSLARYRQSQGPPPGPPPGTTTTY